MKSRPIIFSGPMVKAILDGKKTQTRRVINPAPYQVEGSNLWFIKRGNLAFGLPDGTELCTQALALWSVCPYGKCGDRLWVRETWAAFNTGYYDRPEMGVFYRADGEQDRIDRGRWRPSIHMPRKYSRIDLEICSVRVERLQEITLSDVATEGWPDAPIEKSVWLNELQDLADNGFAWYRGLWDLLNAKRGHSWESNPWVWAISFRRLSP